MSENINAQVAPKILMALSYPKIFMALTWSKISMALAWPKIHLSPITYSKSDRGDKQKIHENLAKMINLKKCGQSSANA